MDHVLDHREINRELAVFATDPLVGAGLPLWLPAGTVIRDELEQLARDIARADGCHGVHTPLIAKRELFERSGHWAKFSGDMFPVMQLGAESGDDDLVLRPANCPHHALVYAASRHSYRELPIRLNELAPMFRAERSGVVSGLSRVRQINLDDTHVFCRPDQVADEAVRALRSALHAQDVIGLPVDYVRMSLRDNGSGYLGDARQWADAELALREAAGRVLPGTGLDLVDAPGEAAFYGPKLDLQVHDGRGHEDTIATVQLDFNQPERFDLTYDGADGGRHRVAMIHRGTVGSMERVVASLLEHYQGRMPLWLAPIQVCVLPVNEDHDGYARRLHDDVLTAGLRPCTEVDGSLGARIRRSRQRRDAVIAVVGDDERSADAVQVKHPASGYSGRVSRGDFVAILQEAYSTRARGVSWPDIP
ncbi:threonine--tRNA ligase [Demetria terragena]|uniref:threonine--tRNA ligase n=1 Tax=Demetria terragena TaxID=63959 RepID=UPI00037ECC8D|nr:threonine--tRNA ligase [Demetria terragena]